MNSIAQAPRSICLLRLSALGDVTHVLPLIHTLRGAWPDVALTWVIGKGEHRLLDGLPGVRFLEYDKTSGLAGMRASHDFFHRDVGRVRIRPRRATTEVAGHGRAYRCVRLPAAAQPAPAEWTVHAERDVPELAGAGVDSSGLLDLA